MTTTDQIIEERGQVYGDFYQGIKLEVDLLGLIKDRHYEHYKVDLDPMYAAYMAKIIMKLSRLSITPDHIDSWADIAGYARLVELHLKKGKPDAENTQIGNEESTTNAHQTEVRKKGGFG
jgi:hypothetical protein